MFFFLFYTIKSEDHRGNHSSQRKSNLVSLLIKYYLPLLLLSVLFADCCGCGKEFKNEQSLVALDKHWHLGCFKCKVCNKVLNAEYISK